MLLYSILNAIVHLSPPFSDGQKRSWNFIDPIVTKVYDIKTCSPFSSVNNMHRLSYVINGAEEKTLSPSYCNIEVGSVFISVRNLTGQE